MQRKSVVGLGIVTVGIVGSGLMMATAPTHTPLLQEEKVRPVVTMRTKAGSYSPDVQLFGRVSTPRQAQLTAAVEANIEQVHVREGQRVKKGELLLSLDARDAELVLKQRQADVQDALAELETREKQHKADLSVLRHQKALYTLMKTKLNRLESLHKGKMVSTDLLDDGRREMRLQAIALEKQKANIASYPQRLQVAQAQLLRAQAVLEQAQLSLLRTRIGAPFDGAVSELSVSLGDRVRPGNPLITVFDTSALEIRASIPHQYLGRLRRAVNRGDAIVATAEVEGELIDLQLNQLTAHVVQGRSGVGGLFQVISGSAPLALGRMVNLTVIMPEERNVVAVPAEAVYDNQRVYIVEDQRLKAVDVEVVGETNKHGLYRVLVRAQALKTGSQIATTQLPQAITGLKVSVINDNETEESSTTFNTTLSSASM